MDYNLGPFRIRPRGNFDSEVSYRYLDLVTYNGGSYININYNTIDGVACIGILPEGQAASESYWQCIASKGDTASLYSSFITVENSYWDYSKADKIIIPETASSAKLVINNIYDGCCGLIVTRNKDIELPDNSDYSIDFNYVTAGTNQYYLYSFTCADFGNGLRLIWNRTVIDE